MRPRASNLCSIAFAACDSFDETVAGLDENTALYAAA